MKVYKDVAEALCKLSQKNHKITKKSQITYISTKYVNVNSQICEREDIWERSISKIHVSCDSQNKSVFFFC